jgi:hypothetical protein
MDPKGVLQFAAPFVARGRQSPRGRILQNYSGLDNVASLTAPSPFDHGTAGMPTSKGGGAMLQVLTPTGTAATGTITDASTVPVAADTIVVNGVTFTWRAAPSAAGDVLIGGTTLASMNNLWDAINLGLVVSPVQYVAVSAANQALLNVATYSPPTGARRCRGFGRDSCRWRRR